MISWLNKYCAKLVVPLKGGQRLIPALLNYKLQGTGLGLGLINRVSNALEVGGVTEEGGYRCCRIPFIH